MAKKKNKNGSDNRFENLKEELAAARAQKIKDAFYAPADPIPEGEPNVSNSFVDVNDLAANVARYGRKFVGPKGSTGTSRVLPRKPKGKK